MIPEIKTSLHICRTGRVITVDGFVKHTKSLKRNPDPVTEIDQKSENFLIRQINHFYPGIPFSAKKAPS
jgi:fructose-1,6-bisphosphatase/inositol monophosphatase family enzyme